MTLSEQLSALIDTPAITDPVEGVAEAIERMTTEQVSLLAEMLVLAGLGEPRDDQSPKARHLLFDTISNSVVTHHVFRDKGIVLQFEGASNLFEFWDRIDRAALREPNNGDN